jgi:hypothetical protein
MDLVSINSFQNRDLPCFFEGRPPCPIYFWKSLVSEVFPAQNVMSCSLLILKFLEPFPQQKTFLSFKFSTPKPHKDFSVHNVS